MTPDELRQRAGHLCETLTGHRQHDELAAVEQLATDAYAAGAQSATNELGVALAKTATVIALRDAEAEVGKLREALAELVRELCRDSVVAPAAQQRYAIALQKATLALVLPCAKCGRWPIVAKAKLGTDYDAWCRVGDAKPSCCVLSGATLLDAVTAWNEAQGAECGQ